VILSHTEHASMRFYSRNCWISGGVVADRARSAAMPGIGFFRSTSRGVPSG
jgi:hypothetical protein